MDKDKYISASTQTRVLEKKLLTKTQYQRLIEAKDIEDVFRLMNETDYQDRIAKLERPEDYEKVLSGALNDAFKTCYRLSPNPTIVDIIALKYEYHNIKVLLKSHIRGIDCSRMYIHIGELDIDELKEEFDSGNRRNIAKRYFRVVDEVVDDYSEKKDPQRIGLITDQYYFRNMYRFAKKTESELILQYVEDLIDFTNFRTLIRAKKNELGVDILESALFENGRLSVKEVKGLYYEPIENIIGQFKSMRISNKLYKAIDSYIESKRLAGFEKIMDDYMMDIIKQVKMMSYGPEVIFAYLNAKEIEIKNLRIIMVSKLNGIEASTIRERIREIYV